MSRDDFEASVRSTIGEAGRVAGDAAGKAKTAAGNVTDAISNGVDAVAAVDFSSLRDDIAKLTQTVTNLVQKQAYSTRDQVMGAVGSAADNISQSSSDAQDKLMSLEADVGARIRRNPWTAIAIAALAGLLIAKLS
jgi:ElaB/YqjD/DUF883 family membrane-anchored ribosome-binding protein